jgi:NAD(P)-dependent dehydrogenase (short-subunit alcohol dehydrogenase family)
MESHMTQDLAGKVFLVTGATDGLGRAAANEFARRGATLTILGRIKQKTGRTRASW